MADIVLKDRNGNSIEYPGVNHIKVKTTDGETRDFVDSETVPEVVENLPIALDFSGGNQEIVAPDGMVAKSAVIQQPATLIPENIAEGVDIAGIIGTLAGGGGGVCKRGTFTATGYEQTINHNLGCVPDFVVIMKTSSPVGKSSEVYMAYGVSTKLANLLGITADKLGYWYYNSYNTYKATSSTPDEAIDYNNTVYPIRNATETSIVFGAGSSPLVSGGSYTWLAIGGLT